MILVNQFRKVILLKTLSIFQCSNNSTKTLVDLGESHLNYSLEKSPKIKINMSMSEKSAFHPQSNESLERLHHALGEFLKQYTSVDQECDEWLEIAILNFNTCVSESTKRTLYEVVFGKLARLPSGDPLRETDLLPSYKVYLIDLVTRLNSIRTLVYENLVGSKNSSKKYYDKTINPRNFRIGDYVFLLKGPKPK